MVICFLLLCFTLYLWPLLYLKSGMPPSRTYSRHSWHRPHMIILVFVHSIFLKGSFFKKINTNSWKLLNILWFTFAIQLLLCHLWGLVHRSIVLAMNNNLEWNTLVLVAAWNIAQKITLIAPQSHLLHVCFLNILQNCVLILFPIRRARSHLPTVYCSKLEGYKVKCSSV